MGRWRSISSLSLQKFCKEALLWQALKHPHILPFYGVDLETFAPRLSMVSPWMPRGHILKHIANVGGPKTAKTSRYVGFLPVIRIFSLGKAHNCP